jgi:hypothetical protein
MPRLDRRTPPRRFNPPNTKDSGQVDEECMDNPVELEGGLIRTPSSCNESRIKIVA